MILRDAWRRYFDGLGLPRTAGCVGPWSPPYEGQSLWHRAFDQPCREPVACAEQRDGSVVVFHEGQWVTVRDRAEADRLLGWLGHPIGASVG